MRYKCKRNQYEAFYYFPSFHIRIIFSKIILTIGIKKEKSFHVQFLKLVFIEVAESLKGLFSLSVRYTFYKNQC